MNPSLPLGALALSLAFLMAASTSSAPVNAPVLEAGFAESDITPKVGGDKPVYIAGFGHNRLAKGVHDPLLARVVVFRQGRQKLALVSVDLVGYFNAEVRKVRDQLPGFSYVLISSTHNHEGPDTLGLWGPTGLQSGVDPEYLRHVAKQIVTAVKAADESCQPVKARLGSTLAPELLHDAREPIVKHDELVALELVQAEKPDKRVGLVVQWNCHPETLDSKNTQISADFVGYTVNALKERHGCPVVYLTGTVGGLMTSLHVPIKNAKGEELADGTFEKTERYGHLLADKATKAVKTAKPIELTPLEFKHRAVFLPLENKLYLLARQLGVFDREMYLWTGNPDKAEQVAEMKPGPAVCLRTEVARLRLGDLEIAAIPGEIYPELVLDKVEDPAVPGVDFPDAPIEPAIYKQLHGPHRMMIGLANDEIGYIIPKRQWDEKPPFAHGRKTAPYGEINSLGPDTAPLLCKAFQSLARAKK